MRSIPSGSSSAVGQPQGALVLAVRIGPGRHARRRGPGLDRRRERLRRAPGVLPVIGELGRGTGRAGLRKLGPLGQDRCQPLVEVAPLAGQQLGLGHLAHERVAEPDPTVLADRQNPALDPLVQRVTHLAHLAIRHRHQQALVDGAATERNDPDNLAGRCRQHRQPGGQRCGERRGRVVVGGRCELLDEVGIAVGAAPGPVDRHRVGLGADDRRHLPANRLAIQAPQVEPVHPRLSGELGEPSARIGLEVLDAAGEDDEHRLGRKVAGEEGHEVARGPVDPVDVLEDEQRGPVRRQAPEDRQHALLHAPGAQRLVGLDAVLSERRHQSRQLRPERPEHPLELGPRGRARQAAKRLGERQQRQAAIGKVEAGADHDPAAGTDHGVRQLIGEARLADPCLAGDEHHSRRPGGRPLVRGNEPLQVAISTNEGVGLREGGGLPGGPVAHAWQGTPAGKRITRRA